MSQDFNKGKIYKITNDYNDEVYIGSTCNTISRRFIQHKAASITEKYQNIPLYKIMNEIGFERFRIELIEEYQCTDKYELRQKEGHFIREIGTLNKIIAGRTKKEHRQENKERIQEYQKQYDIDNKEHKKEYYLNNIEHRKEYILLNKDKLQEQMKEYKKANKDKILEKNKEYREVNKDKIKDKIKEKITCECGSIICKGELSRHIKTSKHQELMKTILTPIIH